MIYMDRSYMHKFFFDAEKALFIRIPKTGTTSLQEVIGLDAGQHFSIPQYEEYDVQRTREYWKFTIVRDPYERFVSAWFNAVRSPYPSICQHVQIEEFVEQHLRTFISFALPNFVFLPQYDWTCGREDYWFKLEEFEEGKRPVLARFGLPENTIVPVTNVGQNKRRTTLTASMVDVLNEVYSADFEYFGYSKRVGEVVI